MSHTEPQPSSEVADKLEASINYFYEKQYPHLVHREALKTVGELRQAQAQYHLAIEHNAQLQERLAEAQAQVEQLQGMLTRTEDTLLERGQSIYGIGGYTDQLEQLRAELATANETLQRHQSTSDYDTGYYHGQLAMKKAIDTVKAERDEAINQRELYRGYGIRLEARIKELEGNVST